MNRAALLAIVTAQLFVVRVQPALGTPATASFTLKDPYITGREGAGLLFGGRHARGYLELMPDGNRRVLPDAGDIDEVVGRSDTFTYVMIAGWTLPLLYALFVPDPFKEFRQGLNQAPFLGTVSVAVGMTYLNWLAHSTNIGPYFQRKTVALNQGAIGQQGQPTFRQAVP